MVHSIKVFMEFRQSLLAEDAPVHINVMKTNYPNRNEYADNKAAFAACPQIMKNYPHEPLLSKGISCYKDMIFFQNTRKWLLLRHSQIRFTRSLMRLY